MQFDFSKKNTTRFIEQNIHNLSYAQFEGVGEYDIPKVFPTHISKEIVEHTPLQGFNFALSDKKRSLKACHFFLHDYQFERVWKYPDRYVEVLKQYKFVLSPQFSTYDDMPKATKIFNAYRNRWCTRYWQEYGITVIPSIIWGDDENFDWCMDGLPKHSTIAISTMIDGRWGGYKSFYKYYEKTIDYLEPELILLYGKDLSANLKGNIVFKGMISRKVTEEELANVRL